VVDLGDGLGGGFAQVAPAEISTPERAAASGPPDHNWYQESASTHDQSAVFSEIDEPAK
jgi:hypothetical protein